MFFSTADLYKKQLPLTLVPVVSVWVCVIVNLHKQSPWSNHDHLTRADKSDNHDLSMRRLGSWAEVRK